MSEGAEQPVGPQQAQVVAEVDALWAAVGEQGQRWAETVVQVERLVGAVEALRSLHYRLAAEVAQRDGTSETVEDLTHRQVEADQHVQQADTGEQSGVEDRS